MARALAAVVLTLTLAMLATAAEPVKVVYHVNEGLEQATRAMTNIARISANNAVTPMASLTGNHNGSSSFRNSDAIFGMLPRSAKARGKASGRFIPERTSCSVVSRKCVSSSSRVSALTFVPADLRHSLINFSRLCMLRFPDLVEG